MHFIRYFPYFMVVINAVPSLGDISTSEIKWLCAEPTCSEPISTAKTVKKYLYPDRKDKVTFSQNEDAVVLKKPADGSELWWVKIGDKTGVAHKSFLKELSTKKKVKELVSAGQGVKVTKTPKYADIEGTRIPIDVDDLPSESNDGVTVTSEDEAETELPSNLVASETQSVVKPSTTAPTVQLPVNGLSQAATVDAKKDAPPELAPEHRPEEEPGKTESPELQMPLNFDNIPSVGLSNETAALPSGISSESGGPVNDTEATATEAPSPLIASTPTAVEPEFSANIPTEATSVNSTPSEIEDFTEQAVLIESVQRADSVDLGETKVTVENPDSEQMNSHQTVDTPSSENSNPEGTKNSAPSAENDASLNGTQPDSQQIGENPSVSDNQSDSPSNLDKKEQSSHDPVTINTSDSQPISKEPFHPPAGPIDLIQVNESNPAAPREEQESSSALPSPKIAEPTSTGTEASLVSPPTPKPQPLRNLLTFGASKLGSIQQNGEVPPLQRQESFNPEIAESLPASSEANNAHSEGYTPPEGTQATTTSPFPSGNESSGDPPPQYQDSQSLNPGMMASPPASPEENSHSEMYSPPEDTKASMTSPLSSGNGNSADPPAQYQDSQSFNPEIMMPPPASAEENAQSEIYSLPEDAQASKTSELPSYSAPQMSQITDPPAVGVVHSESIEATIAEDSPSHEPELSSSWWPPEFLDPLLEALQEYLPASLFSPSCCSQETVVDVLDQPKPVEEEKFCEKEECAEEPPRVPLSMPSSLRLERAYESSSDPSGTAWLSYKALFLMGFTSILVLLFTLGHYYIENLRRDVELASKYNDVSGQLFTEKREKEILEEKLEETQDMLGKVEIYENEIGRLKGQIVDLNDEKASLIKKEKDLTKKYAVLMKNYEELRRVLSESKQKGERFSLMADIKKLEENAVEYVKNIASLKEQLVDKQGEIKQLNQELHKNNELKVKLERDLEKAHLDKQEAVKTLQNSITELQKSLEDNKVTHARLEDECTRLKKELEQLTIEKELAESSLQKAHGLKSSESLSEWLDSKRVRASLLASEKEVLRLSDELTSLKLANSSLQEKETFLENEMKRLNENYEGAEKEKIEALTRLQVLSDYFKEKETQLQDELGMKEALWVQKQSDDDTLYEQMRSLREENQRTKQVNETLKKEIIEQETSYKKLVSTAEEKAYENWVALRHAERRLKEAQMEASQLRARLTSLEASGEVHDDKFINKSGPLDTNGDLPSYGNAASPPFMLYPGDFLPPPPLLNLSGGGIPPPPPPLGSSGGGGGLPRPPPVGRISSPPLDFTPPPPLVNYGMFSPPPPPDSSANSHVLHKPQPREPPSKRHHKDSQSSNHSDSAKDKPVQRNKR